MKEKEHRLVPVLLLHVWPGYTLFTTGDSHSGVL